MELKIPKGEQAWVSYLNTKGELVFLLTSKPARDFYFLYEVAPDDNLTKLGKSRSPTELEEKFDVMSKMRA
ncbi:MAG: hypothetical protein K2F81_00340 [Ruminococcus sp.]|nr:hypothetical protein [Ruminococcus sp.]